jgi:hypothetical protein
MTTARQIVTRALKELMYMQEGESPSAEAISDGLDALNGMLASWHNDGLLIFYPPGKNWLGDWRANYVYAVDDAVAVGGGTYTCTVGHTSTANDLPGASPNYASYWTLYAETPMTLDSTFPLGAHHERGVIALLAIDIAPMFNVQPDPLTFLKSKDGMAGIYGQYFHVPNASVDAGITRMPSQIWPYSISPVQ